MMNNNCLREKRALWDLTNHCQLEKRALLALKTNHCLLEVTLNPNCHCLEATPYNHLL